jgi:hypothetical protein
VHDFRRCTCMESSCLAVDILRKVLMVSWELFEETYSLQVALVGVSPDGWSCGEVKVRDVLRLLVI